MSSFPLFREVRDIFLLESLMIGVSSTMDLLQIKNLAVSFPSERGTIKAVQDLSLTIKEGETHALVGESGCGKSVSSFAILNLIQKPGKIEGGSILFKGEELLDKSEAELRQFRGKDIAMIFQDPMNSLNPVYSCGDQVAEVIELHKGVSRKEAWKEAINLFEQVKIPDPHKRVYQYPHELSGGMRQRVMIAMALACSPKLLIADEPTTALDVTVQAQILALLKELQEKNSMAILFITHDLGVVANIAHSVTVLYAGRVAEHATTAELFANPKHPYTEGLFGAIPTIGKAKSRLLAIEGSVPEPTLTIVGCPFYERCYKKTDICKEKPTIQKTVSEEHYYYCYH